MLAIVAIFKKYPKTAIALVIEPDSLPNLVTNANLQTCKDSASGYREGVAYALKQLNLPNIAMYIDAGHGGWLGWNDNLSKHALITFQTPQLITNNVVQSPEPRN
jgi:cellulose 1,4-beta-cellobiosidase